MNLIEYINNINKEIWNIFDNDDEDIKLSELHMHKILFHLYGAFFKHFSKELFSANFEAWKYGPVEINYRNHLKKNDYKFNSFDLAFNLNEEENEYLKNVTSMLIKKSAWTLVELSHRIPAWKDNFSMKKDHCKIPNDDIKNSFNNIEI